MPAPTAAEEEIMMDEIRLGTIGSGVIVHSILDGLQRTEGIRLTAVYSRKEETGRALAQDYGAERVYTDLNEFLTSDAINTVYIATPNLLHYEQAKKALLAGKHVICEKPFCTQLAQAQELAALAKERHLLLVEAVPTAYLPNFTILKRELPKIGKIKLVMSNYSQYSSRYDKLLAGELPNIFNPACGGGCLMDINFYNAYLNTALFGSPSEAVYYPNLYKNQIDTSGLLVLRYDGFISQSTGAKDTWGVNYFQIEGEQGYIYVAGGSNGLAQIEVVTKTSSEQFNEQPDPDRWYYEIRTLTKLFLLKDYQTIEKNMAVTLKNIALLETVRKAAGIYFPGE